ncbi:putative exosome complex component rrp40 [Tripterygium wilfordii]|uniref:Ribosomal RNA-processing protein 40 n=1 Tax=Tripterygium wilfordii TaxID=458696 RepID=A0A7J7CT87_TRIWF|nr:putative exosome complex component rrp40 [Tripterygium wilfordii]
MTTWGLMEGKLSVSPASLVDQLVVPGDVVLDLSSMVNQTIKLGGGLYQDNDVIFVIKAGKLRFSKPNKYWVESSHKRYVPCVEDRVLGIVVDCKADNFLVDIKGPSLAFLPVLAFEGGTRRNIPKFEVGALLYVRVVKANPSMNPELSCTDASGKAAEFGLLKDGYMFESSTGLSRMLLSSPTCPVLEDLGKKLSFEIAVGLNGRVWVNADSPSSIVIVAKAIMNSEFLSGAQQRNMVKKLFDKIQSSRADGVDSREEKDSLFLRASVYLFEIVVLLCPVSKGRRITDEMRLKLRINECCFADHVYNPTTKDGRFLTSSQVQVT